MNINGIVNEYINAINMPMTPDFKCLCDNHVFDENETVKWNREKVKEHNLRFLEEREKLTRSRNIMIDEAIKKIYAYIRQEIPGLCEEAAEAILEKAEEDSDDYKYDLADNIDEYIMFAKIIRE